jgi:hypothetical protein
MKLYYTTSSHNIIKFYDDLIFYEFIESGLIRYKNIYNITEYNKLIGYMKEDISDLIRDLIRCPWSPCSTDSLSNHNSIIISNAKVELIKILSGLLYDAGEKEMSFGLLFI